jgi:outer membrane protein
VLLAEFRLREGEGLSNLRKSLLLAAVVSWVGFVPAAHAESISGALAKAYNNNSSLNSARAGVRVTDEGVPLAKSSYRPRVSGSGSINYANQTGVDITTGSFGVTISQTIFDGFQTLNNVRSAKAQVLASRENLRNTELNILFNAASSYMDVIRDRQIAALRERNLAFLGEQVRAAQSRLDVGEGTRTDLAQAQASRSAAIAQQSAARAAVVSSEAIYRQIVGEAAGKLQAASAVKNLPGSLDQAMALALSNHPAILATQHVVDASSYQVKSAEGQLLPQLSAQAGVSAGFQNTGPGGTPPGYTGSNSANIGLLLSVPIYTGGQVSAQVRQRKESLGQARIDVDVSRDDVRAAVTSAWTQFHAARESVDANRELVSAAQLALNGVSEERNVGQRTTLDVLNAQASVIDAQINLARSERDVVVASYAILSAVGNLSARNLNLAVVEHKPEEHYKAVKDKWFGLRTPDGR